MNEFPSKVKRYELLAEVGSGGMATVYQAKDPELNNRFVAIKWVKPEVQAQQGVLFANEARAMSRLEHPNIVPIYDVGEAEERPFLVMKWMKGGTLGQRLYPTLDKPKKDLDKDKPEQRNLEKGKPLPFAEALQILTTVGEALHYAHRKHNIIHRDIKPDNILFDDEGLVYMADFGVAQVGNVRDLLANTTGTPSYIAPEIWEGKRATFQTDVYSLACVFYEMLTGERLFAGETAAEIKDLHLKRGAVLANNFSAGTPKRLRQVLIKALAKDPQQRYTTVREFVQAVQALDQKSRYSPQMITSIILGVAFVILACLVVWLALYPPK